MRTERLVGHQQRRARARSELRSEGPVRTRLLRLSGRTPCRLAGSGARGVDGFVFTAGIGENSPGMRARIAEKLGWLGGTLDPAANAAGAAVISKHDGR